MVNTRVLLQDYKKVEVISDDDTLIGTPYGCACHLADNMKEYILDSTVADLKDECIIDEIKETIDTIYKLLDMAENDDESEIVKVVFVDWANSFTITKYKEEE